MLGGTPAWLAQVVEDVVDPARPIVDPHHHLWPPGALIDYGLADLCADTATGHAVEATVFVECSAGYREDGPVHLRPVGETEFVAEAATTLANHHPDAPPIAGIVAHADLTLGARLDEVLDAHAEAGGDLLRGIRDALAHALEPEALMIPGDAPADKARDESFRSGVRRLGERGLTYDSWHYHHQLADFADLVAAAPDTTMVLDHFGTPLGVGRFEGRRDELFDEWRRDIDRVAAHPNAVAKLSGLAMPDNGFGWHLAERPPTSDELAATQARYHHHTIGAFGPDRCMFASNFPVDKLSVGYRVLWNAFKKMAAGYTDAEQDDLFAGTARRVYGL